MAREQGFEVISLDDMFETGLDRLLAHLHERLAGKPVYLCWDMDFFDPSAAPGVCAPAWGGVTAREGLYLLRRLAGLGFLAFDVNTVSPPHDVGGMTAMLAARVMYECLLLACRRPGSVRVGAEDRAAGFSSRARRPAPAAPPTPRSAPANGS